jgi:methionyl-tRNA formyltransferase
LLSAGHEVVAVLTQPDRPSGRGRQLTESFVKKIAKQYNIPVLQPETLQDEKIQKILQNSTLQNIQPQKQDNAKATYSKKINKSDAILDWNKSAIELDCQIRAFIPWPIAYAKLGEQTIRIWRAQPLNSDVKENPGKIINVNKNGIDVATGKGILRLQLIQFSGGKPLEITGALNSKKDLFKQYDTFA